MKAIHQQILRTVFAILFMGLFAASVEAAGKSHGEAKPKASKKSDQDQFKFEKRKIQVGKKTVTVEIADNADLREHGLMFRDKLAENTGMLFIFDSEQSLNFWMKNTLIPLSIGFFDENKKLIDIQEMVPAVMGDQDPKHYPSSGPAMYALEMPKGWFEHNKISRGTILNPGPLSKQHD